jgi:hypothetical protein
MTAQHFQLPALLAAAIIGTDLHSFIRASFPIVSGGDEFLPNWHVEAMAYALAEVLGGRTRRLIITVPPAVSNPSAPPSPSRHLLSVIIRAYGLLASAIRRAWRESTPTTAVPDAFQSLSCGLPGNPDQSRQGH